MLLDLAHPPFSIDNEGEAFQSSVSNRTAEYLIKMLTKNIFFMPGGCTFNERHRTKDNTKYEVSIGHFSPSMNAYYFSGSSNFRSLLFHVNCF